MVHYQRIFRTSEHQYLWQNGTVTFFFVVKNYHEAKQVSTQTVFSWNISEIIIVLAKHHKMVWIELF